MQLAAVGGVSHLNQQGAQCDAVLLLHHSLHFSAVAVQLLACSSLAFQDCRETFP